MSRRIDVELTSDRGDGTWSWRAAGARQPKGVLDASLLYEGARPGDVVRAEADFDIDGITVIGVQPPKGARQQAPTIEIVGVERDFSPITSSLTGRARERAERGEDDRPRRRDDRGPRAGGPGGRPGGPSREGARGARPGGDRPDRPARPPRPEPPAPKPKAKKLRPARVHRDALLAGLSPEQQPIAEQLLRGGMPAVRAALEEQNAKAKADGGLEIPVDTVLGIAEQLVTRTRVADWLDRAEAAKATGEELALRDLRSVVSSADDVARDEGTRELAAELKAMLEQRTQADQAGWLSDIERSLKDGRVVRALRLSSRPPEPGTSFPAELTQRLTEAANGALTADIAPDRWATVLDAVAYSPVRRSVVPAGIPAEPGDELLAAVRKHAGRTPAIATLFGVEPPPDKKARGERPARAAGRNANLSRAGGARNATVPVPGRPGGPPAPPAKRIPPPPGRQIGATLPGTPPPAAVPPAAARTGGDPTAPLAPPSATGTGEPIASVGTPEATPADETPTAPTPDAQGSAPLLASVPDAGTPEALRTDHPEATAPLLASIPDEGAAGAAAPADETPTAPTPDAQGSAPLLASVPDAGTPESASPQTTAPLLASIPDEGAAGAAQAAEGSDATAGDVSADPESAAADPEAAMAFDAAPALLDGPPTGEGPAPAALATDVPPTDVADDAPPRSEEHVEGAVTDPPAMPAREAEGSASAGREAAVGDTPEEDVVLSAPSDSALPEDRPTAPSPAPEAGVASTEEMDALVSQAAEGPFEPPAQAPVEDAPNSGVGTVAAQQEGGGEQEGQQG